MGVEGVVHGISGAVISMGQVPQQFQNLGKRTILKKLYMMRGTLWSLSPGVADEEWYWQNTFCTVGDFA